MKLVKSNRAQYSTIPKFLPDKTIEKMATELSPKVTREFMTFYNEYRQNYTKTVIGEIGSIISIGIKFSFYTVIFLSVFFSKPLIEEWHARNEFNREKERANITRKND